MTHTATQHIEHCDHLVTTTLSTIIALATADFPLKDMQKVLADYCEERAKLCGDTEHPDDLVMFAHKWRRDAELIRGNIR